MNRFLLQPAPRLGVVLLAAMFAPSHPASSNSAAEEHPHTACAVLPAGEIAEVARLADERAWLRLLGQPGQYFSLETSTHLVTWTELGRNTLATGEFSVTDASAIGAARRFYRWRSLPKPCFTCTQVIGFSQVGAANGWYVRDGVFESLVGDDRWQLLWNGGGGVDLWQKPDYVGWNNALVSPCPTNAAAPDRVLLSILRQFKSGLS